MSSKSLSLEYRKLLKNGYIIKTIESRKANKYLISNLPLSNLFIGKKIRIMLEK